MLLPDLVLQSRINENWTSSGIDSIDLCVDKEHFDNFPYNVSYNYNSRGFRDIEWPESPVELKNSIWCIGDSFTVGLGSPIEHTWPTVISQRLNKRTINVSMDGASNEWIARKVIDICKGVNPELIIIMWSYFNRRENSLTDLTDEDRRTYAEATSDEDDFENFLNCVNQVNLSAKKCIHFIVPNASPMLWQQKYVNRIKKNIKYYGGIVPQLDIARDGHHFDILSSCWIASRVMSLII